MKRMKEARREVQGLYRPEFEHDNCGIGAVVNIKGKEQRKPRSEQEIDDAQQQGIAERDMQIFHLPDVAQHLGKIIQSHKRTRI